MTTEPQTTLKSGQTTEPQEPEALFFCKNCGEPMGESKIESHKCTSKICDRCKIKVPNGLYERHMQIHNVAERFTSNELLASLVLTTTEIKSQNETLIRLLAAQLRER